MFKNFKVVSTGQRVGNLTADPMLFVNPKSNRFKLNLNAAKLVEVEAGESVTILADTEAGLFAIHKAIVRTNKAGEPMYKDVKMSEERKEELKAEGSEVPQELVYHQGCKLGNHLEFGSSNAIAQTGLTENVSCELSEVVDGGEVGIDNDIKVVIFNYKDAQDSDDDSEEEVEEEVED